MTDYDGAQWQRKARFWAWSAILATSLIGWALIALIGWALARLMGGG